MAKIKPRVKVPKTADAGEAITVTLGDASAKTKADDAGKWLAVLPKQEASDKPRVHQLGLPSEFADVLDVTKDLIDAGNSDDPNGLLLGK